MSGLELNKIVASILLAALIAMLVGFITDILYEPETNPKVRGYSVAVTEGSGNAGNAALDDKPIKFDIPALMKQASAEAGEAVFKKCVMCHTYEKGGVNKIGPRLWNIVGKAKGSEGEYSYSAAIKGKGGEWDYDSLFHFLHKPKEFAPGTKMAFVGLNKPEDIANVIAFLREKASEKPKPLP
jgi:cytochrome c